MNVLENANTVNLKSASIVVIMLLHEGLTHIQSQIKPWLVFGESFTLSKAGMLCSLRFLCSRSGTRGHCEIVSEKKKTWK